MQITQTYARNSGASLSEEGLQVDMATETSRPPVHLDAMIDDSLDFGRVMLALHDVVSSNLLPPERDHSAYQEWVQQKYLEELPGELQVSEEKIAKLLKDKEELSERRDRLRDKITSLSRKTEDEEFYKARQRYWKWLYKADREAWIVLDPVVSVHPDCLIFEVFSQDESSYGRVTVPAEKLQTSGETQFGTTNIDYSLELAREMARARSYRPAWLRIGGEQVVMATSAGHVVEKKIDLPESWLNAFVEVQSAASFPGVTVELSPGTLADVLDVLFRQKEKESPRSLRFKLTPGEKPVIVVEPWNIEIPEHGIAYNGDFHGEIRIWGRRRLFLMEPLLPCAEKVQVKLLGTGMPSYWSVELSGHRFDLGLSGWTSLDWSSAARFSYLSAQIPVSEESLQVASAFLEEHLEAVPEDLAKSAGWERPKAAAALRKLCRQGQSMFDPISGAYRWRRLIPFDIEHDDDGSEADRVLERAQEFLQANKVSWKEQPESEGSITHYFATVEVDKAYSVKLDLDADLQVKFAECTCGYFRREKLRKGPCAHILAATLFATAEEIPEPIVGEFNAGS